jgi:adenylate cyclase
MITPSDILAGRILVVDDKEANVILLQRMLRGAGYLNITSTMRSEEVCELHMLHRYDLILLDLEMPGMDGFQVMENLKEIEVGGYLPVLVITAQPGHKLRALKAGAKDFVSKPFDLAEVLLRVRNMVEVRLLHTESRRLYEQVLAEQRASERLLVDILPRSVTELFQGHPAPVGGGPEQEVITASYAEVTVLFADIVEFARFAEGSRAEVLVGALHELARRFESTPDERLFDEARTIGEAYLATVGMPKQEADQAVRAVHKAVELVRALDSFNHRSRYKLKVRIGFDAASAAGPNAVKFDL